jgi:hypothetical protein
MASQYRIERECGTKESPKQLAVLREKWPLAFPAKPEDVRPLASAVAGEIGAPPPPIETPPVTPEQLRARVRAALLRRSA